MVPLEHVLTPAECAQLAPAVHAFYRDPRRFSVRARIVAMGFSHFVLRLLALLSRQCLPVLHSSEADVQVCQWLYRDCRGRLHWDRYAVCGARVERLFTARIAHAPGQLCETFVCYGVPVPIQFTARVEGAALLLESRRTWRSPLSLVAQVVYRTAGGADGLVTHGRFRVPWLALTVDTEFRITPDASSPDAAW